MTFLGFQRPDGRIGIRNHVVVLSAMDNTNPSARRICDMVSGTVEISTPFGRGQIGADMEITRRTLAGLGAHPNVAAVLVLSLSEDTAAPIAERIRASGKPVEMLGRDEGVPVA